MINRKIFIVGVLLTSLLLGCGTGEPDTFVRFEIEGQSYEVKGPTFVVTRMIENFHFMDLTYFPMTVVPGAMVQWRMRTESLEKLVGQDLDLNTVDQNQVRPLVLLILTEDLSVHNQRDSNIHFKIDRIEEGAIEGSFSGKDFMYVSKTKEVSHEVDVTARFRARLIQKKTVN